MIDDVLMTGIMRKGENVDDPSVVAKYAAVADKRPVLMSAPPKVTVRRLKQQLQCGLAFDFINVYKRFTENPVEMGTLKLASESITLDPEVYYVLKGLAYLSLNKSEKKAVACREVFLGLVGVAKTAGTMTKGKLYNMITEEKADNYYVQELYSAIKIVVFGHAEGQYYYSKRCEIGEYYMPCYKFAMDYVLKHFETPKEVDTFINAAAKKARADKEFMSTLRKKTSKYLYAIMYEFKDEHPEILREFPQEKGFL